MLSLEPSAIDLILAIEITILLVLHIKNSKSTENENPSKKPTLSLKLHFSRLLPHLSSLCLIAFGSIILAWVSWLIWYDVTMWGKDLAFIFFGSRTNEAIGLGIGMKIFDYFLIGLAFPLLGLFILLRRRLSFARAQQNSMQ
jgi:hypothetical protein